MCQSSTDPRSIGIGRIFICREPARIWYSRTGGRSVGTGGDCWGLGGMIALFSWLNMPPIDFLSGTTPLPHWLFPPKVIILHSVFMINPVLVLPTELLLIALLGFWVHFGFRSITRQNVLENPARARLFRLIMDHPGIHLHTLRDGMKMNRGTVRYHLFRLERGGMITCYRDHRCTCYFENNGAFTEPEQRMAALLRNSITSRILGILKNKPGISRKGISKIIGLTGSTVTWHMKRMETDHLIITEKNGKLNRYQLSPMAQKYIERKR
jgi:predicted transcriptional regulator